MKEPVKSFLHRAMQELRVHIALENAWPRLKGTSMEKVVIPLIIIEDLQNLPKYQADNFQKDFSPLWLDEKVKAKMGRYVSGCRLSNSILTMISFPCLRSTGRRRKSDKN